MTTEGLHIASRDRFLSLGPKAMADFVRRDGRVAASRIERLKIFVMLGRPRTCVLGVLAYALGYGYTGAPLSPKTLLGAFLSFAVSFAANLHNTATDLEEDTKNLPGRVLLIAKLGHRPLLILSSFLSAFMMASGIALGVHFSIFMALALIGLHQYSAPPVRSKGRPVLGLWVFAQAVVFPFLFGWCTEPGHMLGTLFASILAPFTGAAPPPEADATRSFRYLAMWAFLTVWFMAKGLVKNVPDFAGDRDAGVRSSATAFRSQRSAAIFAVWATIAAYLTLAIPVALGLESRRLLLALVWLLPIGWNGIRLVRARDGFAANEVLRTDMLLSTGFAATLLLLLSPGPEYLAFIVFGGLVFLVSDVSGIDSRRPADSNPMNERPV